MNMLSLRVSSIKGSENLKKNSDVRHKSVAIPAKYLNDEIYSGRSYIKEFQDAKLIDLQIKIIKSVSTQGWNDELIQFFSDVLFETALKHPVRQTIMKLFQNVDIQESVIRSISVTICEHLDQPNALENSQIVTAFIGYFENFQPGYKAIANSITKVITFLEQVIIKYISVLRDSELSPAFKNEVFLDLHYAVRVIQMCLQQFESVLTDNMLQGFQYIIQDFEDVPMDTKVNCGSVIALHYRNSGQFPEFLKDLAIEGRDILNLCLNVGYINTFDPSNELIGVEQLIEHGRTNANDAAIILAVMRGLLQWSKQIVLLNWTCDENVRKSLEICLDFTLISLEHHLDSIRHLSRDILRNVTQFAVNNSHDIVDRIFETQKSIITQCHCLNSLAHVMGVEAVIERNTNGLSSLITNLSCHTIVGNTYETLMTINYKEISIDVWYKRWIEPLLTLATTEEVASNLIKKSIKLDHKIAIKINESKCSPQLKLSCLGTARKHGLFNSTVSTDSHWKDLISFDDLKTFALVNDDEVAISAFRLIAETHKSTEKFDAREFEIILVFLEMNMNCQSPAMRQHILAYMKIIVLRLRSVLLVLKRTKNASAYDYHSKFLDDLHQLCMRNIHPCGNFSRRTIALRILIMLLPDVHNHWTEEHVLELVKSFEDSYDINKDLAIDVLLSIPRSIVSNCGASISEIATLASSIRPNDSTTAAYHVELYVRIKQLNFPAQRCGKGLIADETQHYYFGVLWCVTHLESALEFAQKNGIVAASQTNPFYGYLFCLRHLCKSIPWKNLPESRAWKPLFERLIALVKNLTAVVSPIVNNSSPEGHFPNDIDDSEVTPQMLLLCAWRTVKEISLLLGDITLHAPIEGLISIPQIHDIGQHFTQLLAETKHRGAFEQAYVGFSSLCQRLWSSTFPELHTLPLKWLENLIGQISGDVDGESDIKLCATRRSAGVPFMVQALITSELQVCSSKGLKFCMMTLLEMARSGGNEEARTHSLNILRALYRCSDLGEAIAEFIADGIQTAILGYDAGSWAEQNSSTLLFSALMVRVFGVQRTKQSDNLNIRNKMTGRIFFLRYPKLFDFFLTELQTAAAKIQTEKYRRLHPILLLLSRLYPSSLEGSESSLKLSEALPHIISCSSCPELQTRILIAKSIVALITPDYIVPHILMIAEKLESGRLSGVSSNLLHSMLLQMLHLIYTAPKDVSFSQKEFDCIVVDLNHILKHRNLIIVATYIEIIIEVIFRMKRDFSMSKNVATELNMRLCELLETGKSQIIGFPDVLPQLALLQCILLEESILCALSPEAPEEYRNTILNLVLLICVENGHEDLVEDFEIAPNELKFVAEYLDDNKRKKFRQSLTENYNFGQALKTIALSFDNFNSAIKALTIISSSISYINIYLNEFNAVTMIRDLVEFSHEKMDQIKIPVHKMIYTIIEAKPDAIDLSTLAHFLLKSVLPENHDSLREMATHILIKCIKTHPTSIEIFDITRAILIILRDDNPTVRKLIATSLTSILRPACVHCPLRSFYLQKLYIRHVAEKWRDALSLHRVIIQLLMIVCHEHLNDEAREFIEDEQNDFRVKVFDKNETNVFGERNQVIWDVFQIIQELDGGVNAVGRALEDPEVLKWAECDGEQLKFLRTIDATLKDVRLWIRE